MGSGGSDISVLESQLLQLKKRLSDTEAEQLKAFQMFETKKLSIQKAIDDKKMEIFLKNNDRQNEYYTFEGSSQHTNIIEQAMFVAEVPDFTYFEVVQAEIEVIDDGVQFEVVDAEDETNQDVPI